MVMKKKFNIALLCLLAIMATAIGAYWYYAIIWKYQIHWQSGPEVHFTASDLANAQLLDLEIADLAKEKVIAVAFTRSETIYKIITDPNMIRKIVDGLLKSKRIEGYRPLGGIDLEMIFEDHTKVGFTFTFDWRKEMIKGTTWDSKELYPLFRTIPQFQPLPKRF
jgi:hypothetical protein